MVRVINTTPHPSVVKEVVCKKCGSLLEYVPNDIQNRTVKDYGGGSDTYYFIKCPPCGADVYVKPH